MTVGEAGFNLSGVQKAIDDAVAAKNVSAIGDTYVSATVAEGTNTVTVAASESTIASLALADSAIQAADITTGTANGTIAVEGVDVAVKGLGAAAYVDTTATPTENSTAAFTAGGAYVLDGKITANTAAIEDVKDEVSENAQVTSAALNDLNSRLTDIQNSIPTELGVMSITASTSSAHVAVTPTTASDGEVTVTVDVTSVDAANTNTYKANGLATDAYVDEKVAALSTAVQSVTSAGSTLQVTRDANNVNVELAWASF